MADQVPSVGRIVHYVYGNKHVPAIITEPAHGVDVDGTSMDMLAVFPPGSPPFSDLVGHSEDCRPGTWHWPEFVPPQKDEGA